MKLTVPKLKGLEDKGFNPEVDIFLRKDFGERLAGLVEKSHGNIVFALDAEWGEGKSTFIKMWMGHTKDRIKSIYFDAFANDYQKDPFLTLASEMYALVEDGPDKSKSKEFKEKAGNAVKTLARGGLKIAVRNLSGGILDGTMVDSTGKDISAFLAEQVDGIIEDKLQHITEDKNAIIEFRKYLQKLAKGEEDRPVRPVVFIIDELDRCRPDFALELVEQIKHLFSVPGITFLLVVNKTQLEESVKARYGNGIEATVYLQKFVNVWLSLPRTSGYRFDHQDDGARYIEHVLGSMLDEGERAANEDAKGLLCDLVKTTQPSL